MSALTVGQYRSALGGLTVLAARDLRAVLRSLEGAPPAKVRDVLMQALPEVLAPYMTGAGTLAATWYEDLRAAAHSGRFYARPAEALVAPSRIESLTRWGVSPLFGQSESTVMSLMTGGVQRLVEGAARDTIQDNIGRDRVRVGFGRIPKAGCCSFCGMLASRGAVYRSEESAGAVTGRGVDESVTAGKSGGQGLGVRARGAQDLEAKFHDFCRCVARPVFEGDSVAAATQEKYEAMYREAGALKLSDYGKRTGRTLDDHGGHLVVDLKGTLAAWRKAHGTQ